jgi:hypothetical protein
MSESQPLTIIGLATIVALGVVELGLRVAHYPTSLLITVSGPILHHVHPADGRAPLAPTRSITTSWRSIRRCAS